MTVRTLPSVSDVVPVAFSVSPARHGWVDLTIEAGGQRDRISCSYAYDPFEELVRWATQAAHGLQGCVEVDEEGRSTLAWLTREPGSYIGRLRVFEPGASGAPEPLHVDETVDVVQVALAFHDAFSAFARTYDAAHWHLGGEEAERARALEGIDLAFLAASLASYGVLGVGPASTSLRAAYQAELGAHALPIIPSPEVVPDGP